MMDITKIDKRKIININNISKENIRNLFFEFGKRVLYIVSDSNQLVGIITFGDLLRNLEKTEIQINQNFQSLVISDENIYEKAKEIFDKFNLITIIPVLDHDNILVGEIIEKSIEQIVKQQLQGAFLELKDTLLNEDMKKEMNILKKVLCGRRVLLIGHNYLSTYIKDKILGICRVEEKKWTEVEAVIGYDFIIDMDVYAQECRLECTAYDLKGIKGIYSCLTFLLDINEALSLEISTNLERAITNPHFSLKDSFEFYNGQKIYIKANNIYGDILVNYCNENQINYEIVDNKKDFLRLGLYIAIDSSKNELNPLIKDNTRSNSVGLLNSLLNTSIEVLGFEESQRYIQNNYQHIQIYNFCLNLDIEKYNEAEVKRFEKGISINDLIDENRIDELSDFYNQKIENVELIKAFLNVPLKRYTSRGIVHENKVNQNKYYINSVRRTSGIKEKYKNTIYCFGACLCEGYFVTDEETIQKFLQSSLNDTQYDYRVINVGSIYEINISKMAKSINFQEGDIVLNFYYAKNAYIEKEFGLIRLNALTDYKKECREVLFMDSLVHFNGKANELIANEVYSIIRKDFPALEDQKTLKNLKVNSYYDIFNNDDDIDLYKYKMADYFNYMQQEKGDDVESGAVIVNCNPFTLGHLYLVEYAAKSVKQLYIFVVEENKSYFSFQARFEMVKLGVKHLKNVRVIKSGEFVVSDITMPAYFKRELIRNTGQSTLNITMDVSKDLKIFGKFIAPQLHIKRRFVGEEIHDLFTKQYNDEMKDILPRYGIEVEEIRRLRRSDEMVVSASTVREYLNDYNYERIKEIVPDSTYEWLRNHHYFDKEPN